VDSGGSSKPLSLEEIERMRRACRAAAQVLSDVGRLVAPGVTTDAIDAAAHLKYIELGGYPSTLGYRNFPKSLCTSVNEVVTHGIPDDRPLQEGDIVNLDITIYLEGVHGDTSATFAVGPIDEDSERLLRVTRECLLRGIEAVQPGKPISEIGRAIEPWAHRHGYGVVRDYGGHGIDHRFHTDLHVPHHFDPDARQLMLPGMIFTIEPMITMGSPELVRWSDRWTEVTADGQRSAQYEHTILVTEHGGEVLTKI
jgi:methionyl aminopeptidase